MKDLIANCLEIVPGSLNDYHALAEYHYRTEPIKPATQIYKVRGTAETNHAFPDPIAVLVYRMPIPDLRPRTVATKGYFHVPSTLTARLKLVNEKIQYIARIIVDPRFRRLGIATWLLKDTLEFQQVPIIETLTPIDFTNRLFLKAGFKLYHSPAPKWCIRFQNALSAIGLADWDDLKPLTLQNRIDHLEADQAQWFDNEIHQFVSYYRHREHMPAGIDRTAFALTKIPYPQAYLIWFNPRVPLETEKPANFDSKNPIKYNAKVKSKKQ